MAGPQGSEEMRAGVIVESGHAPQLMTVPRPVPRDGEVLARVLAAPLNPVDVAIAGGRRFDESFDPPFVTGYEAVGEVVEGGRLEPGTVIWFPAVGRRGALAEFAIASETEIIELGQDADPLVAAALGIAGQTGWLAIEWRGRLARGEHVLILGATGPVGQVAVQAARYLGASRIVGVGRSQEHLDRIARLGADATVAVPAEFSATAFAAELLEAGGGSYDLIIDMLWGPVGQAALLTAGTEARIVQVGNSAGPEATIASGMLRGGSLDLLGFSLDHVPHRVRADAYRSLLGLARSGDLKIDAEGVPLDEIGAGWAAQINSPHRKLVLFPAQSHI